MKIVAVTSCPTGIAHTFMAAESLEQAAAEAGHHIVVETQGAAASEPLTQAQIDEADAVILAADVEVRDRERFAGKPTVHVGVKRAISDPNGLFVEAAARVAAATAAPATQPPAEGTGSRTTVPAAPAPTTSDGQGWGTRLRGWLMTGVSYMIPFVAAGGILIALAFMIGGAEIAAKVNGGVFDGVTYSGVADPADLLEAVGIAGVLFKIGATAFSMLVPILAGFIAYGMAGRTGLVAGVVAGLLANTIGAGFLGGLVGGLLAGAVVLGITKVKVPRAVAGVMPVVVIPLLSALLVGFVMLVVVGKPIATAQTELTDWLSGLSGTNAIVLGLLLGAMMAFDMGGPVNKVAYTFALGSLASGNLEVMAAVMAAGMVPPLALALATVVRKRLFTEPERKAGEAAWLLGASFITEGAIPFAAADPLRVIPPIVAGSAVTGALSMEFGATSRAPHGGIWVVGLVGSPGAYLIAILAGVAVAAAGVIGLKSLGRREPVAAGNAASDSVPSGHRVTVGV